MYGDIFSLDRIPNTLLTRDVKTVSVQVFDINGRMLAIARLLVPAKTSMARFLSELIPGLPAKHVGPVRVDSIAGMYATGLRFTGNVLTAIPPALSGFFF